MGRVLTPVIPYIIPRYLVPQAKIGARFEMADCLDGRKEMVIVFGCLRGADQSNVEPRGDVNTHVDVHPHGLSHGYMM